MNSRTHVQTPQELYGILAHSPLVMQGWSTLAQSLRGYDYNGKKTENMISLSGRHYHLAKLEVALKAPNPYEWWAMSKALEIQYLPSRHRRHSKWEKRVFFSSGARSISLYRRCCIAERF